ncbi:ABC transporter permease [Thermococcus prieurii]
MRTVRKQLVWELEDPYISLIFIFSFILLAVTFYTELFKINTAFMPMGLNRATVDYYGAKTLATLFPGLSKEAFVVFSFTGVILASFLMRYDRDTGVARSVYSLPMRNYEGVLAKFLAVFIVLFISAFSAAFFAYLYAYGDSPRMIVRGLFGQRYFLLHLLYWFEATFYVSSVSSLIALLCPTTFAAILGGIAVMYVPGVLGWGFLPPDVLNSALIKAYFLFGGPGERVSTFFNRTFYAGLFLPLVAISLALIISEWRDVA